MILDIRARRERAIFRLLLDEPSVLARIDLEARHFRDPHARELWRAALELANANREITGLALVSESSPALAEKLDGWMLEARSALASAADLSDIVEGIRGEADLDAMAALFSSMAEQAITRSETADELAGRVARESARLCARASERAISADERARAWVDRLTEDIIAAERGEDRHRRISTGLYGLDEPLYGGFGVGAWTFVVARPKCGKSTLLHQCARRAPVPAALFIYEEVDEVIARELAVRTGIPAGQIVSYKLTGRELGQVRQAAREMRKDLLIVDARGMDAAAICRETRRLVAEHGVRLLVVDYLNRMPHRGGRDVKRHEAMTESLNMLDAFVGEMRIAGVMGAQANRASETSGRPPRLADAKDCGAIEEVAKQGICLYRPGREDPSKPDDEIHAVLSEQNIGEANKIIPFDWCGRTFTISDKAEAPAEHEQGALL
jgi:replicative DNA helicase